jgi:hypothetical protein
LIRSNGNKLTVFENRVLKTKFGHNRDDEACEWRKLHNDELNDLYSSPNIVRVIKKITPLLVLRACRGRGT